MPSFSQRPCEAKAQEIQSEFSRFQTSPYLAEAAMLSSLLAPRNLIQTYRTLPRAPAPRFARISRCLGASFSTFQAPKHVRCKISGLCWFQNV